jgi:hypothetical protein
MAVATLPPRPQPSAFKALAKPLPLWARLTGIAVLLLGLIVLQLTDSHWGAGALHVGIAAGVVALLVVVATAVRSFAGMAAGTNERRLQQYLSSALLVVPLGTGSTIGIGLPAPIHRLQV